MVNYSNAKIYKLWSPQTDIVYIGSTVDLLCKRFANHKCTKKCMSRILFEKYTDVRIELIEEYPCDNREQLNKREGEIIRATQYCINRNVAGRTIQEYYQQNKEYYSEYNKEYREKNKESIREWDREYHKEYNSQKVECECGCVVSKCNLLRHKKSAKHLSRCQLI